MSLLSILAKRQQSAAERLTELAKLDIAGKAAGNVDEFAHALTDAGLTRDNYEETLGVLKRAKELKAAASNLDATGKAVAEAGEAIKQHAKETIELTKQLQQKRFELLRAEGESQADHRKAVVARAELQKLEYLHAGILGLEPHDLDRFSLTSGGGVNVLNRCDPTAPMLEVPMKVWSREGTRRATIFQVATERALSEHNAKAKAWASGKPRDYSGYVVSDEAFPAFQPPGWHEVVERGWNVELDGLVA